MHEFRKTNVCSNLILFIHTFKVAFDFEVQVAVRIPAALNSEHKAHQVAAALKATDTDFLWAKQLHK